MATDVIMPQMGESIFEGTITKWLKKAGDPVQKDEPLFEISTDKVDAEIPSPVAGVLTEIKHAEGETVQVNTVVAVIGGSQQRGQAKAQSPRSQPARPAETPSRAAETHPRSANSRKEGEAPAAATIEVVMPQMGESIFEGTITRWLKGTGDPVRKDEPLFEISTDKVDAEIPSPADGVLAGIRAAAGETVPVNTVVAVLSTGQGGSAKDSGRPPAPDRAESQTESRTQSRTASRTAAPEAAAGVDPAAGEAAGEVSPRVIQVLRRIRSSPLVRRIARENAVDLEQVPGTGSAGRVTRDDILGYLAGAAGTHPVPAGEPAAGDTLGDRLVPLTRMRAIIAERMVESARTIPHAQTVYKVDMTRVVRLRETSREEFERRHGIKLTYMPFIAGAAVEALGRHPILNASFVEGSIQYHGSVHLGIAVALDWGLIVPVVRRSQDLDLPGLAGAIQDLAVRARAKRLQPAEVGGSTFTLTNAGLFGGEFGTAIINQPESAILAIGGLRKEPVVLTDAEGNDAIAIRSIQYFCLGFDHRLIDGADAGRFMTDFKNTLEGWSRPI